VALLDTLAAVDAGAYARMSGRLPRPYDDEAKLAVAWKSQGFGDISAGRIDVTRTYRDFDDLWEPLLTGSTPSTMALAALPEEQRDAVRIAMKARLATGSGAFSLTAEAMAVRGIA
jgi:hypothetical protein